MPMPLDTVSQQVYEAIRQKILQQEFAPGTKFTFRQLAETLGVSRIPISEAVRRLEQERLVVCTSRGVYISSLTVKEVEEVFDLREVLEGLSCRLFTPVVTSADLEVLRGYGEAFDRHLAKGRFDLAQDVNIKFHLHIAKRSPYPYLAYLVETLLIRARTLSLAALWDKQEDWQVERWRHEGLLSAIASRDPERAEEAAREHVRLGKEDIITAMLKAGLR